LFDVINNFKLYDRVCIVSALSQRDTKPWFRNKDVMSGVFETPKITIVLIKPWF